MADKPLFHPDMLSGRAVHVIGAGSLGSALIQNLLRMNTANIHVWDADLVEARNRLNQRVFKKDIGMKKTRAQARVADMLEDGMSEHLVLHDEFVTSSTVLSGIVLAAVDSMAARKAIWEAVKLNPRISFFADGRVGLDGGKAYGLDPNNVEHIARYEDPVHMHGDPERVVGACKTEFPLPAMADIVAGHELMRLVRWLHLERGVEDAYDHFVGFFFVPNIVQVTEQWDEVGSLEEGPLQCAWLRLTGFVRSLFWR